MLTVLIGVFLSVALGSAYYIIQNWHGIASVRSHSHVIDVYRHTDAIFRLVRRSNYVILVMQFSKYSVILYDLEPVY